MMGKNIYFALILKANDVKQQRIDVLANTCLSSVVNTMFQNPVQANLVERGNIFVRPSAKTKESFEHTVPPSGLAKKC